MQFGRTVVFSWLLCPLWGKTTRDRLAPLCMTDPVTSGKCPDARGFAFFPYYISYSRGALDFLLRAAGAGNGDGSSLKVDAIYRASEPGSYDRDNLEEIQVLLYHLFFLFRVPLGLIVFQNRPWSGYASSVPRRDVSGEMVKANHILKMESFVGRIF
jgi:hypothetical protein